MIIACAGGADLHPHDDRPVPWWSFTKTVLAAAALVLVGQDRLALDAPLPNRAYTLRQLLAHRAGLPDYGMLAAYHAAVAAGEPPWPEADMLHRVEAKLPRNPPGERFSYSNIGYMLVAQAVVDAAGAPLGPALERLVLRPLGVGARLGATPADLADTAWGNAAGYDPGWVYHGLLVGSVGAAAALLHRLLAGALLGPDLLAAMRTAVPLGAVWQPDPARPWRTAGYGLGLMMGEAAAGPAARPGRLVGHTGGGPGSTIAVYRAESGGATVAAAAPIGAPGPVEYAAMAGALEDLPGAGAAG